MAVHLHIENTGAPEAAREQTFRESLLTIGREASNVLQLDDAVHSISRRHAVVRDGAVPEIMDLGSRNGTRLNGERLEPRRGYALQDGDVIALGAFRLTFRHDVPTARSAPETPAFADRPLPANAFETYIAPAQGASRADLERAVAELRMLNELAVDIGASLDADAVIDRVVRRSLDAIHADQGMITLLIENEQTPDVVAHRTMVRTGREFDLNEQLEIWMVQQRRPFRLNDPRGHPVFHNVRWKDTLRNLLSVPLFVRGKMTGLLTLYNKHGDGGFTEADVQLASIIAGQSAHIIENARLFEEQKELIRMQQEMQVALDIQTNLLPTSAPEIPGYDVAGRSLAAQTVGGDHFDYIPMSGERWALCVGDVSGKGLPAALVMANLQATLRAQASWTDEVTTCLEGTNVLLHRSTNRKTFVTLFYGILDPATHRFRYANAGHNRPLVIGAGGVRALTEAGFALGALRKVRYEEASVVLEPDDTLLIFSDGVVEARAPDGSLYEDERLEALAARHHGAPAADLVDAVMADVLAHTGDAPRADDVTILALHRTA